MIIDLSARYKGAFGFVSATVSSRLTDKRYGDVVKTTEGYGLDVFVHGESTFDEVTLYDKVGGNEYHFGYSSLDTENAKMFATPPMLNLQRAKRLVESDVDNSDIIVVERFNTNPWEITWQGLLIDLDNHQFPIDKLKTFNEIFEVNSIWKVASEILNAVGVEALYIRDIKVNFVEGFEDTIAYTLTTRAIKPLEYQLLNNKS